MCSFLKIFFSKKNYDEICFFNSNFLSKKEWLKIRRKRNNLTKIIFNKAIDCNQSSLSLIINNIEINEQFVIAVNQKKSLAIYNKLIDEINRHGSSNSALILKKMITLKKKSILNDMNYVSLYMS